MAWEKFLTLIANIMISEHWENPKVTYFCKFLALFCIELLAFENPMATLGQKGCRERVKEAATASTEYASSFFWR
jgi:hypothetical protein